VSQKTSNNLPESLIAAAKISGGTGQINYGQVLLGYWREKL
jgi:hypothetical protein